MKIQVYSTKQFRSWEEAEKKGAVYDQTLPQEAVFMLTTPALTELVGEVILVSEQCLCGAAQLRWRIES